MKNDINLTDTQRKFLKFINTNLDKNNRIIVFESKGHFGMGYTLKKKFPKSKILSFSELKIYDQNYIPKNLFSICIATFCFILRLFKIETFATGLETFYSNLQNIKLNIDKKEEFFKNIGLKKSSFKYRTPKYIITINNSDVKTTEDLKNIKKICSFIYSKRLNKVIVLIKSNIVLDELLLVNEYKAFINNKYINFELTNNDINHLATIYKYSISSKHYDNVDLIRALGLDFFISSFSLFDSLSINDNVELEDPIKLFYKIKNVVDLLIYTESMDKNTKTDIYQLLEFSSFFKNQFTKTQIVNFKNNILNARNLELANKTNLIGQYSTTSKLHYRFDKEIIHSYFSYAYTKDLFPIPKDLFCYFKKEQPFHYKALLDILWIDKTIVDYTEYQSILICGYYYNVYTGILINENDYLRHTFVNSLSYNFICMYESFRKNKKENLSSYIINNLLQQLNEAKISNIAYCCICICLLQVLKENFSIYPNIDFDNILFEFKNQIIQIESIDNYHKYWICEFKCQYIAFSLESETLETNTEIKFLTEINKCNMDESLNNYIYELGLRKLNRVELLAFSIGHPSAEKILSDLFNKSDTSTKLKELARINYSAYLIENNVYKKANVILNSTSSDFIKSINIDTYCAYMNNLYLSKLKLEKLSPEMYVQFMKDLCCNKCSANDLLIMHNNLACALLEYNIDEEYAFKLIQDIITNGNVYSKFYAMHNMAVYYSMYNRKTELEKLLNIIQIPKLLKSETTFFNKKFNLIKEDINLVLSIPKKTEERGIPLSYYNLFLYGTVERWFE